MHGSASTMLEFADVNAFSAGVQIQPMKAKEDHQGALDASLLQINGIWHQAKVADEVTHRDLDFFVFKMVFSPQHMSVRLGPGDWMAAIDSRTTNIRDIY